MPRIPGGGYMDQTSKPDLPVGRGQYDANYGNFQVELYEQIRRDAFGEDIGQNSWLTAAEQDRFINWLGHTGGFVGPYVVGYLNDRTGSLIAAFVFIAACYLLAGAIIPLVKLQASHNDPNQS